MPPQATAPKSTRIIVRIEDVDIKNRVVHAFDKMQGRIQVSFRDIVGGGLLRIPVQDEKWIAERVGYNWRLKDRLSSLDEQSRILADLEPGDAIFTAPGVLYLDVEKVAINDKIIGHTVRDVFTNGVSFASVTLSASPSSFASIQPFINGLLLDPTQWTISDKTITFASTLAAGTVVVYYEAADATYTDAATSTATAVISATETYTP